MSAIPLRLLVTGGQGFVGRQVAAAWLEAIPSGQVLAIGRSGPIDGYTHRVHHGDREVVAPLPHALRAVLDDPRHAVRSVDLLDPPALVQALREFRPHAIVHLAGALRSAPHAEHFRTNLSGTANLIEAIAGAGIDAPRLVLVSSGATYGAMDEAEALLGEDRPLLPEDSYAISKVAAERLVATLCARHRVPWTIARVFNVTGPGADERHAAGRFASRIAAIRAGQREPVLDTGPLDAVRDYVDVRDVAAALVALARVPRPPPVVNVASGRPVRMRDLLDRLVALAGVPVEVVAAEGGGGVARNVGDPRRLRALGLPEARPLDVSLADLLAWYAEEVAEAAAPEARTLTSFEVVVPRNDRYNVDVRDGIVYEVPDRIATLFPGARVAVLTDPKVDGLYGDRLRAGLDRAGLRYSVHLAPEGEAAKTSATFDGLIGELYRAGFDRRAVLVCFGGGAVSDLGGFVASALMRGVAYVNVPTTLLAQHDAAVGGKVAVNTAWAKNFVGAFHHPRAVWADPGLLATLDDRDLAAGMAEAIKVALCGEPGLFAFLERHARALREDRDPALLGEVVLRAARHKAALLAPDPYEIDLRRVLNLGHTFGHPLETELAYEGLRHGEAVGFGLAVSVAIARGRRLCEGRDADRILALLNAFGLPPRIPRPRLEAALAHLDAVRLVRGRDLNVVLPTGIGSVTITREVDDRTFREALDAVAAHPVVGACVAS